MKNSYCKFLTFILISLFHINCLSQCDVDDFTALRDLYLNADGDNWIDTTGWSLVKDNITPPVGCNLSSMAGVVVTFAAGRRVIRLNLSGLDGAIPQSIERLDGLEHLNINDSNITGFPVVSDGMNSLETVRITNAGLDHFPIFLTLSQSIESLNLSNNNFTARQSLPTEIGDFTKLKELIVNESRLLGSIPPEIGQLTNLERLELKQNRLSGFVPREIGSLTKLRLLDLSSPKTNIDDSNNFTGNLSTAIGNLDSLRFLSLGNNNFNTPLPATIGNLSKLYWLDLMKAGFIGPIPTGIGNLSELFYFRGSFNDFTSLPSTIGGCGKLESLELSVTLIDSIPSGIGSLDSLKRLDISESEVEYIDPDIGGLQNLEYLGLNSNPFVSLPDEIGMLSKLETLRLFYGELTSLPSSMRNLDNLVSLDLSYNWLSGHLPCWFGEMESLEWLDINYNNFSGCYDTSLVPLCGEFINIGNYEDFAGRGNNLPDWDQFCLDQSYTCPVFQDTVYWELRDTSKWSDHVVWNGRQIPSYYEYVKLPAMGNPLFTSGGPRYMEIDSGIQAETYTLEIEEGVEFHCPLGATLEVLSSSNYSYQSECQN